MSEPIIRELTSGKAGIGWMRYCYYASLAPDGFRVKWVGFVPIHDIDKLSSEPLPAWHLAGKGCLRVIHRGSNSPKDIRFISTKWNDWFSAFESLGIPTEDPVGLRYSDTTFLKASKAVNLAVATIAAVGAVAALIVVIVVLAL